MRLTWEDGIYYLPDPLTPELDSGTVPGMARSEVIEYTERLGAVEPVHSTSIVDVWYNRITKRMTVKFISGGLYSYDDVDEELYHEFSTAESLGQFFRDHFRVPGEVWPGAKHDEHLATFKKIRPAGVGGTARAPAPVVDLDALKVERLTSGAGPEFEISYAFSGEGKIKVRAADVPQAVGLMEEYFEKHGINVVAKGVYIDFGN